MTTAKMTIAMNAAIDHMRETVDLPERFFELYVVDDGRKLLGAIGLIVPAVTRVLPWLTPFAAVGLATVMVLAEFIEPPLMVWIFQATVAQLVGEFGLQRFDFGLEACDMAVLVLAPQRQRLLQQGLELPPEVAGSACLQLQ